VLAWVWAADVGTAAGATGVSGDTSRRAVHADSGTDNRYRIMGNVQDVGDSHGRVQRGRKSDQPATCIRYIATTPSDYARLCYTFSAPLGLPELHPRFPSAPTPRNK